MLELVYGTIEFRGKTDDQQEVQAEHDHRNAVVKTADDRRFHIHDRKWRKVRHQNKRVPQLTPRRGQLISHFPVKGDAVYALVDFAKPGVCGRNPEAIAWCAAANYEEGLKRIIGQHHVMADQDEIVETIRMIISDKPADFLHSRISHSTETLDRLICGGLHPRQNINGHLRHRLLMGFIHHYLYGIAAEGVNELGRPAPS